MKKVTIILFCFIGIICKAQNPTFDWVNSINGSNQQYAKGICHDPAGNVYVAGNFSGNTNFSTTNTLTSIGSSDVYVAKFNSSGVLQWANNFGASGATCEGIKIISDNSGNIYVTGYFEGSVDFDPSTNNYLLNSNGSGDVFLAKYSNNGSFIWAINIGGTSFDMGTSIDFDNQGNLVIGGAFRSIVDFDPSAASFTLSSPNTGNNDGFFAKYNTSGAFIWAKSISGNSLSMEWVRDIKVDASNNIYLNGYFNETSDFDPSSNVQNITSNGSYDIYFAKYNSNGDYLWANSIGGTGNDLTERFEITPNGSIYLTGNYQNIVDMDPSASTYTISSVGQSDMFIAKYSNNGSLIFANSIGGTGTDYINGIKIDIDSNLYITGMTFGNVDFDPSPGTYTINTSLQEDAYIAKYNNQGALIWAHGISSVGSDRGNVVDVFNSNIYCVGEFNGLIDFDFSSATYTLNTAGGFDAYVLKLNQCLVPSSAVNTTNSQNQLICTGYTTTLTASAATGTLSWYSSPSSTTSLGTGTAFVTPTLSTGTYTYYVEVETCTTSISRTPISVTVSACTGINELGENLSGFNLYPNPAENSINIMSKQASQYLLINLDGKVIEKYILEGNKTIDLSKFTQGVYFIKNIATGETKKIILIKE